MLQERRTQTAVGRAMPLTVVCTSNDTVMAVGSHGCTAEGRKGRWSGRWLAWQCASRVDVGGFQQTAAACGKMAGHVRWEGIRFLMQTWNEWEGGKCARGVWGSATGEGSLCRQQMCGWLAPAAACAAAERHDASLCIHVAHSAAHAAAPLVTSVAKRISGAAVVSGKKVPVWASDSAATSILSQPAVQSRGWGRMRPSRKGPREQRASCHQPVSGRSGT